MTIENARPHEETELEAVKRLYDILILRFPTPENVNFAKYFISRKLNSGKESVWVINHTVNNQISDNTDFFEIDTPAESGTWDSIRYSINPANPDVPIQRSGTENIQTWEKIKENEIDLIASVESILCSF